MPITWKCEIFVAYVCKVKINLVIVVINFSWNLLGELHIEDSNLNCEQILQQHNVYKNFSISRDITSTQYVLSSTHWRLLDTCTVSAKHKNQYKRNKLYSCAKTNPSFL